MTDTPFSGQRSEDRGEAPAAGGIIPAAGPEARVAYDGTAAQVFAIALRNALFNILTLGFYRFWAKTRLRRYIWGGVSVHGDRFEYTGRPVELFLGFLVAIVALAAFLFGSEAGIEWVGRGSVAGDTLETLQGLAFFLLLYIAMYRARRYRLTRTQWRSIRGGQSGSAIGFALRALGWTLVLAFTMGLAYPVFRTRLVRYQMENTWFGNQCFSFNARAGDLFGRWIVAWLFVIPTLGLTYVWYRVQEFRYFASCTRFGPLQFDSKLPAGRVIGLAVIYVVLLVVVSLAALGVAGYLTTATGNGLEVSVEDGGEAMLAWLQVAAQQPGLIVLLILYLVVVGVVRTVAFLHPLIGALCNSLTAAGEIDFEALAQSTLDMPGRGEGLADALDVGSI